jgi:glycosyltransferase involved in cell wall biosynthesis
VKKVDVSVVLNMHREAYSLPPTLFSLDACASEAKNAGINVELICVFDRPDQDTLDVFHQTKLKAFERIKTTTIDVGSLGLARNAGIDLAEGEFVWTSDGDDLVSRNSIVELVKTARNHPHPKVAVFLDYLAAFGEQYHVVRYVGSQWLTAADFAYHHPYVSRIFIRRSAFDSLRYLDLKVTKGFAYEDWDFNTRLFAAGFDFAISQNTILFYRQRGNSLLRRANAASAKMIPHTALFEPKTYLAAMRSAREKNPDWHAFIHARQRFSERNFARELMASEVLIGYLAEAARLDPEVEPKQLECAGSYCSVPWNPKHWGFQLERFFQLLGSESFTDVLLLPWLKPGGAEKYILQVLHELCVLRGCRRLLVLSGQAASRHEWIGLLPKGTVFIDVFNTFPMLDDSDRDSMLARALLAIAAQGARLHIKASPFSDRLMDFYGSVLSSAYKVVYYRFCDASYKWHSEHLSDHWAVSFLRRQLHNIDLLISDCRSIVSADSARLGAHEKKYQCIYAHCAAQDHLPVKRLPNKRLLWASRVSRQKRPELVERIASALLRYDHRIVIEVYGQIEDDYKHKRLFNVPGSVYRGSYDGFHTLPIERFDAFIYTSAFDGLPNVILEVLGTGLPVIAPDVGGIGEAVIEGETGFLVPDLVDENALVEAYVNAVQHLYDDWDRTMEMTKLGRQLIADQHCEAKFRQRIIDVFELASHGEEVSS